MSRNVLLLPFPKLYQSILVSVYVQATLVLPCHKPVMAMLTFDLIDKFSDQQHQRKVNLKAREKNRKKFVRKLRRMHQLAMANAAIANR